MFFRCKHNGLPFEPILTNGFFSSLHTHEMVKKVNGSATPTTKGKRSATTTPVAAKLNGKAKKDSSSSSDSSSDEEMPLAPGEYWLLTAQ